MLTTALLPPSLQDNFELKLLRKNHKTLPTNIQKFIGTLKRCVRKAIKKKGGTPYSIVRSLFMYWGTGDSSPSGTVCAPSVCAVRWGCAARLMPHAQRMNSLTPPPPFFRSPARCSSTRSS